MTHPSLSMPIEEPPRRGFTRRQLIFRGGMAGVGLFVAGVFVRLGSILTERPSPGLAVFSDRERKILTALIEAALPGGSGMPPGDPDFIIPYADHFIAHGDPDTRLLFRAMLAVVEEQPRFTRFSRFSRLSLASRLEEVEAWERTPIYLKRAAFQSLKMVIGMGYFEQPQAADAIGFYVGCAPPHLTHKAKSRLGGNS